MRPRASSSRSQPASATPSGCRRRTGLPRMLTSGCCARSLHELLDLLALPCRTGCRWSGAAAHGCDASGSCSARPLSRRNCRTDSTVNSRGPFCLRDHSFHDRRGLVYAGDHLLRRRDVCAGADLSASPGEQTSNRSAPARAARCSRKGLALTAKQRRIAGGRLPPQARPCRLRSARVSKTYSGVPYCGSQCLKLIHLS